MRILAVSDLHGDLASVRRALDAFPSDLLLCCGDWGDFGEVDREELLQLTERIPVLTVFGNHDDLEFLQRWSNRDGSPVLLSSGERRYIGPLVIAGISGIWAKSHRKPYWVTDIDVEEAALRLASGGQPVDILLSHGCPSGVADLTLRGNHGGQRCFLHAFQLIKPHVYLTGHLHRAQEHRTRTGQVVRNLGTTPHGDFATISYDETGALVVSSGHF